MKSEKTALQVYLYTSIAALLAVFVFQSRKVAEAFQMMGIPGTSTSRQVCIGSDGVSNCRFIDTINSTADTLVIRERTGSSPTYACGKTSDGKQMIWNSETITCDPPTDSVEKTSVPVISQNYKDIKCKTAEETYFPPPINRCAVIAGTVPRCLKDGVTATDDAVKAAMACYAKRYSDPEKYPSVTKLGSDTALLWNEFTNLGIYNLRNPCCDPATAPVPAGSVKIGTLVVEKDWKFWTMIGLSVLILIIAIASVF